MKYLAYSNKFYEKLYQIPDLTKLEEVKLIKEAQKGSKKAQNELIMHYLKLILTYINPCKNNSRYDEEDLFQEGVIALISSIKSFKPEKDVLFGTYAIFNLKNQLNKYINKNIHELKVPYYLRTVFKKIKSIEEDVIKQGNKQYLSPEYLSLRLNIPQKTILNCLSIYKNKLFDNYGASESEYIYE